MQRQVALGMRQVVVLPYYLFTGTLIQRIERQVDLILDAGSCGVEPTTIVNLTGPEPVITRVGRGDTSLFGV